MPILPDGRHDWPAMLALAVEVGLTTEQFWNSSQLEFAQTLEGSTRRQRRQQELAAWHAANIMQMWTKTKLSVAKLLGKEIRFETREEYREYMKQLQRKAEEAS